MVQGLGISRSRIDLERAWGLGLGAWRLSGGKEAWRGSTSGIVATKEPPAG
jgi:hypothetical protein